MQTLDRIIRRGSSDLHRVELPFEGLTRVGYGLAMGQLGMVAAGPGVGKSALANQIALASGLRALYVSADTDSWTMTVRTLAYLTGWTQDYVTMCLEGGHTPEELQVALHHASTVQYSFDTYSVDDLKQDCAAYGVIHGALPELIVVDNVRNLSRDGDSELSAQLKTMDELHALAQVTGAHVLALHHATGKYHDGDVPIPLSGVENKLTQLPSHVLTLHRKDPYVFASVVKNRTGKSDPSGTGLQVRLRFDGERQTFLPE